MRKRIILEVLRLQGHGVTPSRLFELIQQLWEMPTDVAKSNWAWLPVCLTTMENEELLILHRADGSGGTTKGEIVLVCLRPEGL